jgi:hypothetical protein
MTGHFYNYNMVNYMDLSILSSIGYVYLVLIFFPRGEGLVVILGIVYPQITHKKIKIKNT